MRLDERPHKQELLAQSHKPDPRLRVLVVLSLGVTAEKTAAPPALLLWPLDGDLVYNRQDINLEQVDAGHPVSHQ